MAFGGNIIIQTPPQARALAGKFGGEEGLEDLGFDRLGNTRSVVADLDSDMPVGLTGSDPYRRLIVR